MLMLNGHAMECDSANEIYIWCSALPGTSTDILKSFSANYDTIIKVLEIEEFVFRIKNALQNKGYSLAPHLGTVIYNRGEEVKKEVLNNQTWNHNIFQKGKKFSHQKEYRISFSNSTFDEIKHNHIDLLMGNCSDIIKIET